MNVRIFGVRCMIRCMVGFCLISMMGVWLGMFDAILFVTCMLVCVCELDTSIECAFNRVKT